MTALALHEKHTVSQIGGEGEIASREADCFTNDIKHQLAARDAGYRKIIRHGGRLCCRCHTNPPISAKSRYCKDCRRAYNEQWRAQAGLKKAQEAEINTRNAAIAEGVTALLQQHTTSKGNDNDRSSSAEGLVPAAGPSPIRIGGTGRRST